MFNDRKRSVQWLKYAKARERSEKQALLQKELCRQFAGLKRGEAIKAVKHFAGIQQMHEKLSEPQPALLNRHGVLLVHDSA